MIVAAHRVDVARLDRDRPAPPGSLVVVDLRDRHDVTLPEAWQIRGLAIDADHVTVVGGTDRTRAWLVEFLAEYPDIFADEVGA